MWDEDDPRAFLGIATPGFPNLFFLYGPTTNLGHGGSMFFQVECQMRYVALCLKEMLATGAAAMECSEQSFVDYNERLDAAVDDLIWSHVDAGSWYVNRKGRSVSNSPWRLVDSWNMTSQLDPADWTFST